MVLVLNNLEWTDIIKKEVRESSYLYSHVEKAVPYLYKGFDLVKGYAKELLPDQEKEDDEEQPPLV